MDWKWMASAWALLCITAAAPAPAAAGGTRIVDHSGRVKSYEGAATCLACHALSAHKTDLLEDVFTSAHFQLRTPNALVDIPGGGSHGMMDRACGLPGSTLMAGNFAGIAPSPTGGAPLEVGCGECHVARRAPYEYASAAEARDDVDCLICHAATYAERRVEALADGTLAWTQDRSLAAAQSVGFTPGTEQCLRCHAHGLDGYKRATPFTAADDVHAARGLTCLDCHPAARHRIARGTYVTDGTANDDPATEVACGSCHGSAPHVAASAAELNAHVENVRCEVCHVPAMRQERNGLVATRAWAPWTLDPRTGQWEATPVMRDAEYPGFDDANTRYFAPGTAPTVRWFDGGASMLAQPGGSHADRASAGGDSMLFALKPFVNGMLFDAGWFPGPASDPTFDPVAGTWPYSMKWYYELVWQAYLKLGLVDPAYPTAAQYFAARPDMAAMLNNFPMMLQADRAIFLAEAGQIVGVPMPGPQTAATYPGVAHAIESGMDRLARDLGLPWTQAGVEVIGSSFWSGAFFGMWVPPNMDPSSAFYGELASFITMSHAVRPATEAVSCLGCHAATADQPPPGRLPFAALGYPDVDGNGIVDPRFDHVVSPPPDVVSVGSIAMTLSASRRQESIEAIVSVVSNATGAPLRGATVAAALEGPDGSVLGTFERSTGSKGTALFTYSAPSLAGGTYTFRVATIVYGGATEQESAVQTLVK